MNDIERVLEEAKAIGEAYTADWGSLGQEWFDHPYDWARGPEYWYWMERGVYANRYVEDEDWVLDLCCGDGSCAQFYANKAWVVYGMDSDQGAIDHAIEHYDDLYTALVCVDVLDTPLDTWNIVLFFAALEHFDASDGLAILHKVAQAVSPGGRLLGSTPLFPPSHRGTIPGHHNEFDSVESLREFLLLAFDDVEIWTSQWSPIRTEMYFVCRNKEAL